MSCTKETHTVFVTGKVARIGKIQHDVFMLQILYPATSFESLPTPGQFFMLKAIPSTVLLCRPISVYCSEFLKDGIAKVSFLILKKGQGTKELCSLEEGQEVALLGPVGNSFPQPESNPSCIIGGGIGVAPVAGFAQTLNKQSYDFFACFRSGSYGLENIEPNKLIVTTEDGSCGLKGILPDVLTAKVLSENKYGCVYACGPEAMLAYVKKICKEANIQCYLSMERRMACGVGACLGCTIPTTQGNKRCCKDGPVFPAEIINFPEKKVVVASKEKTSAVDLSVEIAGVKFANPVIAASGTFGYGSEYSCLINVNQLGGICSKGLTLEERQGNQGIRLQETPSGIINSIGLENPGIPHFISNELPAMMQLDAVTIANLSGSTVETYVQGAKLLAQTDVPMIELNISCPNVKAGGMTFGLVPEAAAEVTAAVCNAASNKPIVVKLSPNAPDVIAVAHAVRKAGAKAISLINTVQALSIDIEQGKPIFANVKAGLSGPAIKPLALRLVYDLVQSINALPEQERIPVIGLGGISCWQDAVEFIMAGATAIQVGTATFANPFCMNEIVLGLKAFMERKGYSTINEFRGIAHL
ncbi:MAG: dihydroorotate dehydrogenase [Spirochaetaceae bacterium]|nr:dihydroorotate dehydrogenase [Spirochaetaceae bacterium]